MWVHSITEWGFSALTFFTLLKLYIYSIFPRYIRLLALLASYFHYSFFFLDKPLAISHKPHALQGTTIIKAFPNELLDRASTCCRRLRFRPSKRALPMCWCHLWPGRIVIEGGGNGRQTRLKQAAFLVFLIYCQFNLNYACARYGSGPASWPIFRRLSYFITA